MQARSNWKSAGLLSISKWTDRSPDDLEATITQRPNEGYDECVMRDFKVLGILAVSPLLTSQ